VSIRPLTLMSHIHGGLSYYATEPTYAGVTWFGDVRYSFKQGSVKTSLFSKSYYAEEVRHVYLQGNHYSYLESGLLLGARACALLGGMATSIGAIFIVSKFTGHHL